jgi:hypothetical protein
LERSTTKQEMGASQLGQTFKVAMPKTQVMGAKIWWRWLKNLTVAWAQLWRRKYTPLSAEDQLIRHNEHIQGSNIWNTAWKNRTLVQNHAFWELRDGRSARFW